MRRNAGSDHDAMVARLAEMLRRDGYTDVRADLTGAIRPEPVILAGTGELRMPDVTARGQTGCVMFEVETAETIDGEHSAVEWSILSRRARELGAAFWIAVPAGHRAAAELRLRELSIDGQVLEL